MQALHSSSASKDDGTNVYLGNPLGLVLHFPSDKTLYHMGDTDIFSDMALINELHEPKIGLVPIGDRFTMGGAVAALACRRFFDFETVCLAISAPSLSSTRTPTSSSPGWRAPASTSSCRKSGRAWRSDGE